MPRQGRDNTKHETRVQGVKGPRIQVKGVERTAMKKTGPALLIPLTEAEQAGLNPPLRVTS